MKFQAEPDKRLSLVFLVLFAAATLYLSFVIARPFLTPILSATLIAIGIYPLYLRLSRKFQNRGGAALVATLVVLIAIVLPAVLIVEKLAHETTALYGWLNERQAVEGGWREYVGSSCRSATSMDCDPDRRVGGAVAADGS